MTQISVSLLGIFAVLLTTELLWKEKRVKGETARKIIHITVGTFIAFWPFYLSFTQIRLLSIALFTVIMISRKLKFFSSIHNVRRKTIGDIWFPLAVGLSAVLTSNPWVFMAAILHMSLADGLAALVGLHFGKSNRYTFFGNVKSLIGTATFVVVSVVITGCTLTLGFDQFAHISWPILLWLPLIAAVLENAGSQGSDNILVTSFVILALATQHPL